MKEIQLNAKLGPGMFYDVTEWVRINLADGARIEVEVIPMTQDIYVELVRKGVKFQSIGADDEKGAVESFLAIFNRIVRAAKYISPEGEELALDGKYKDRLTAIPAAMTFILDTSKDLAVTYEAADEGNSGS